MLCTFHYSDKRQGKGANNCRHGPRGIVRRVWQIPQKIMDEEDKERYEVFWDKSSEDGEASDRGSKK